MATMITPSKRFFTWIMKVKECEQGAMAVLVALALPVLIGLTGLAMDAGGWYVKVRTLQTAADAAALSGAYTLANGGSSAEIEAAALSDANDNSFNETGTGSMVLDTPPTSGAFTGDVDAVEVNLEEKAPLFFSSLFVAEPITITARAVAKSFQTGEMCMLALDTSESKSLWFSGNVDIQMSCGVASNSSADDALYINGNVDLTATTAWSVGGIDEVGSVDLNVETKRENASSITDPYADLAVPPYSGCDYTDTNVGSADGEGNDGEGDDNGNDNGNDNEDSDNGQGGDVLNGSNDNENNGNNDNENNGQGNDDNEGDNNEDNGGGNGGGNEGGGESTLSPGVYCGGMTFGSGASVHLDPGIYIIDGGDFRMSGTAEVFGEGVTIILTSSTGSDHGEFSVTGNTRMELSGPESGDMAGVVLFQDRTAPTSGTASISGTNEVNLSGAVYFPSQAMDFGGTGDVQESCIQIIARTIKVHGDVDMQNECQNQPTERAQASVVMQVE